VTAFLAHEAEHQVRPSTIGRRVAAIRYAHKLAGLALQTDEAGAIDRPRFVSRRSGSLGKICLIGNTVAGPVDRRAEIVKGSECAADM
jgi:hypothetical protein